MSDLSVMGFLNEETQQETEYNLKDAQARQDITAINGKIPSAASSSNKLVDTTAMNDAIGQAVSAAYKPAGNKTVAELTSSLLVAANRGKVYNMTDAGTTTADFVEGAGHPIRVGDDVGICEPTTGTFKFNILSGFIAVDTNPTQGSANPVSSGGVYSEFAGIKDGQSIDSFGDVETALAGKVDKVQGKGLSTNDYDDTAKGIVDNIQDNVVDTLREAEVIESNNLFSEKYVGYSIYGDNQGTYINTLTNGVTFLAKVAKNTDYVVSKKSGVGNRFRIAAFTTYPTIPRVDVESNSTEVVNNNTLTTYSFNSGNYEYIAFTVNVTDAMSADSEAMIRVSTEDDTYHPYYIPLKDSMFPRSEQAVLGAKNLITIDGTSSGIFTINADKTVTVNGSGVSERPLSLYKDIPSWLKNCYLSGGKSVDKKLVIGFRDANDTWIGDIDNTSGDTKIIIPANATKYQIKLVIGNVTLNNEIFYPMISFDGGIYAPPAMTNKELTDKHTIKTWTNDNLAALITDTDATDMSASFVQKMGNLVVGRVQFKYAGTTTNTTKTIMTLPDELKPAINYTNKCYDMGNNSTTEGHDFYVDTAGQLQINLRGSHDASRWVCCNFTYISK